MQGAQRKGGEWRACFLTWHTAAWASISASRKTNVQNRAYAKNRSADSETAAVPSGKDETNEATTNIRVYALDAHRRRISEKQSPVKAHHRRRRRRQSFPPASFRNAFLSPFSKASEKASAEAASATQTVPVKKCTKKKRRHNAFRAKVGPLMESSSAPRFPRNKRSHQHRLSKRTCRQESFSPPKVRRQRRRQAPPFFEGGRGAARLTHEAFTDETQFERARREAFHRRVQRIWSWPKLHLPNLRDALRKRQRRGALQRAACGPAACSKGVLRLRFLPRRPSSPPACCR